MLQQTTGTKAVKKGVRLNRSNPNSIAYKMDQLRAGELHKVAQGKASRRAGARRVCYLHYGSPKTGTSSIQNSLAAIGARDHWRYVHAGLPNSSIWLYIAFMKNPLGSWFLKEEKVTENDLQATAQVIRAKMQACLEQPAETYIISGEGLAAMSQDECGRLIDFVSPFVDEVRAIGYLRPMRGYVDSLVQQSLKGRLVQPNLDLMKYCPRYREQFEKFDLLLGEERNDIFLFDRAYLFEGDSVADFADRLGIRIDPAERLRANDGLSLEALYILQMFRSTTSDSFNVNTRFRMHQVLLRRLGDFGRTKFQLGNQLLDDIAALAKDDLDWAERRVGHPLYDSDEPQAASAVRRFPLENAEKPPPLVIDWYRQWLAAGELPDMPRVPTPQDVKAATLALAAQKEGPLWKMPGKAALPALTLESQSQ